jgi:glycosyltransferase involved in cell wall biosynthesis
VGPCSAALAVREELATHGLRLRGDLAVLDVQELRLPAFLSLRLDGLLSQLRASDVAGVLALAHAAGARCMLNGLLVPMDWAPPPEPLDLSAEVDAELYRDVHADLAHLSLEEAERHYVRTGRKEARRVRCPPLAACVPTSTRRGPRAMRSPAFQHIFINFPQFHSDETNDRLWGKDWTDFTNIRLLRAALSDETVIPLDTLVPAQGYYDYSARHVREAQGHLLQASIPGAVIAWYYYDFGALRALQQPLAARLEDGAPAGRFFLIWANEGWSRRWDPEDDSTRMVEQSYAPEHWAGYGARLAPILAHPDYYCVDGRPVLGLCNARALATAQGAEMRAAFEAARRGLPPILYMAYGGPSPEDCDFIDVFGARQPDGALASLRPDPELQRRHRGNLPASAFLFPDQAAFEEGEYLAAHRDVALAVERGQLRSGREHWDTISHEEREARRCMLNLHDSADVFRAIGAQRPTGARLRGDGHWWGSCVGFCNASRLLVHGRAPINVCTTILNVCPFQLFAAGVRQRELVRAFGEAEVEHILHNALNEWGEGNAYEPCLRWGDQKLRAVGEADRQYARNTAFLRSAAERDTALTVVFTHYGGGGTEQWLQEHFPEALVVRPDVHDSGQLRVHSCRRLHALHLKAPEDHVEYAFEYLNFVAYEELYLLGDLLASLRGAAGLRLVISHLLGFSPQIYRFIAELRLPFAIPLHDYHFLFADAQLPMDAFPERLGAGQLASLKSSLLHGASKLVAPSCATRELFLRYHPSLNIDVRPWNAVDRSGYALERRARGRSVLVYGELRSAAKGREYLAELLANNLDFHFHVAGRHDFVAAANVTVSGEYVQADLPALLAGCDVVLFLSAFPETFCYAAVPAFESSACIIAPPYGAFLDHAAGRSGTLLKAPADLLGDGLRAAWEVLAAGAPIRQPPVESQAQEVFRAAHVLCA